MFTETSNSVRNSSSFSNIPIPKYTDRDKWAEISEDKKHQILTEAEKYLGYIWPTPPASMYLEYSRNGNRSRYEDLIFNKRRLPLEYLVFAELIEGKGRFTDDIVNGIWSTLDEATWVVPAHNNGHPLADFSDSTVIDLFSAECAGIISWALYELRDLLDSISPQITYRMSMELEKRIFTPFLENDYWWSGLLKNRIPNNWNPWIISNILTAVVFSQPEKELADKVVDKCLICLDEFVRYYAPDGGCDEGPCYWAVAAGCLFESIDIINDYTNGKVNLFDKELIKNMCSYIYKMHISGSYFVCYADADAKTNPDPYLLYRMGLKTGDTKLTDMARAFLYKRNDTLRSIRIDGCEAQTYRKMKDLFCSIDTDETFEFPYVGDAWFDGIEVMTSRISEGTDNGLFLSAKGGNNGESHNHNDIGNFVIYNNGLPAIVDIGRGKYVKKTFSDRRYEIFQMQSGYHNIPIIGNIVQKDGMQFRSANAKYTKRPDYSGLSLDLRNAYPENSGIVFWERTIGINKSEKSVTLSDDFSLSSENEITFVFITAVKPVFDGNNMILHLEKDNVLTMSFDDTLIPSAEIFDTVSDEALNAAWGSCLYRVMLKTKSKLYKGQFSFRFV